MMEGSKRNDFLVYVQMMVGLLALPGVIYCFLDPANGKKHRAFVDPCGKRLPFTFLNIMDMRLVFEATREIQLSEGHLGGLLLTPVS